MKTAYVLGAGFSKAAGLPLVHEFGEKLIEQKKNIVRRFGNNKYTAFERVISYDNSIEKAYDEILESGIIEDFYLIEEAITYIIVACCESYREEPKLYRDYKNFLQLVKNQNASIISLNYDTVLEITLYIDLIKEKIGSHHIRFDYKVPGWEKFTPINFPKEVKIFLDIMISLF